MPSNESLARVLPASKVLVKHQAARVQRIENSLRICPKELQVSGTEHPGAHRPDGDTHFVGDRLLLQTVT